MIWVRWKCERIWLIILMYLLFVCNFIGEKRQIPGDNACESTLHQAGQDLPTQITTLKMTKLIKADARSKKG